MRECELDDVLRKQIRHCGTPAYTFEIGCEVSYGGFSHAVVKDSFYDNRVYLLEVTDRHDKTRVILTVWSSVRKIEKSSVSLSENDDIRLTFHPKTVDELLSTYYYNFGVDTEPKYQRDYVWDEDNKVDLIDSIFKSIDIGKIVLVRKDNAGYDEDWYEILDGKQRLLTLVEFYEDRFPYKGLYYSDLGTKDRLKFENAMVSMAILDNASKALVYRLFILLNTTGKSMSKDDIAKVVDLYNEEVGK